MILAGGCSVRFMVLEKIRVRIAPSNNENISAPGYSFLVLKDIKFQWSCIDKIIIKMYLKSLAHRKF